MVGLRGSRVALQHHHSDSDGEGRGGAPWAHSTPQAGRPLLRGSLAGPLLVTVARPLWAPHFLDPSFLGLGVDLAYGEKGGLPSPTSAGSWHPGPREGPAPPRQRSPSSQGSFLYWIWNGDGRRVVGWRGERAQPDARALQCPRWRAGPWALPGGRGCAGKPRNSPVACQGLLGLALVKRDVFLFVCFLFFLFRLPSAFVTSMYFSLRE